MFDVIMVAGWEILEGKHTWVVKSPSGVMFAVNRSISTYPARPVIYDIFDTFIRYVNKPHKHLSI
jgi:hypothetical protein